MYRPVSNAMGFSLKPPKWLRNIVSSVTGGAVKVTNPLQPTGTPAAGTPSALDFSGGNTPSWVMPAVIGGGALLAILLLRKGKRG